MCSKRMGGRGLREPAVLLAMHRVAIKRQRLPRRCRWRVGHAVLLMKAETRVMTGVIVAAVIVMIIIVVDVDVDVCVCLCVCGFTAARLSWLVFGLRS